MGNYYNNALFWQKLDTLHLSSEIIITKPKGFMHPLYSNLVYPVDTGYLKDTLAAEDGIAVYRGSDSSLGLTAAIIAADVLKKDVEIKLLIDCTDEETETILRFLNQTDLQKAVLIERGTQIPAWGETDN